MTRDGTAPRTGTTAVARDDAASVELPGGSINAGADGALAGDELLHGRLVAVLGNPLVACDVGHDCVLVEVAVAAVTTAARVRVLAAQLQTAGLLHVLVPVSSQREE